MTEAYFLEAYPKLHSASKAVVAVYKDPREGMRDNYQDVAFHWNAWAELKQEVDALIWSAQTTRPEWKPLLCLLECLPAPECEKEQLEVFAEFFPMLSLISVSLTSWCRLFISEQVHTPFSYAFDLSLDLPALAVSELGETLPPVLDMPQLLSALIESDLEQLIAPRTVVRLARAGGVADKRRRANELFLLAQLIKKHSDNAELCFLILGELKLAGVIDEEIERMVKDIGYEMCMYLLELKSRTTFSAWHNSLVCLDFALRSNMMQTCDELLPTLSDTSFVQATLLCYMRLGSMATYLQHYTCSCPKHYFLTIKWDSDFAHYFLTPQSVWNLLSQSEATAGQVLLWLLGNSDAKIASNIVVAVVCYLEKTDSSWKQILFDMLSSHHPSEAEQKCAASLMSLTQ